MAMPLVLLASLVKVDSVQALSCVSGSLADYVSLGSGGCTIGSNTLFDFTTLSIPAAATEIPASSVTVNPIQNIADFGLDFVLNTSANAGEFFDVRFGYSVTGLPYSSASVGLSGSGVIFDGANTAITDLCLGIAFVGDSCGGTPTTLIAFDIGLDSQLLESATFAPVNVLGVITDIGIDGGLDGSASLTGASNRFPGAAPTSVPEPPTALLLALGLLLSWLAARALGQPERNRR
jgi:hypothetical protein